MCGFGTYRGRGCLEKRIFPLLNGEASWVGSVRIRGVVASTVVDRASPVFSADEDVHNPSVDGLGTSWGVVASTVGDRRSYAWVATVKGYYVLLMQPSR